ncbi:CHAT domain-containing protein [Streptomyces sp. NPDC047071]|uniref:CHAT domain-containing protein n=1 Tax=Streptomyces sp. NPDC047071 TaxID=3154808 RepID=UPI003453F177
MTEGGRPPRRSRPPEHLLRHVLAQAQAAVRGDREAQVRLFDGLSRLRRSASALAPASAAQDLTALTALLDALGQHGAAGALLDDLAAGILQHTVEVSRDAVARNQLASLLAGRGQLTAAARLLDDVTPALSDPHHSDASPSEAPPSDVRPSDVPLPDTGPETEALAAHTLANAAGIALRRGDLAAAQRQAAQALDMLDALHAGDGPASRRDARLLALAVSTAAARATGEHHRADSLLPALADAVRDVVAARGSDHPASLSALVTLASAESASARAAGDTERLERAADVLAIAAQKASALMGPEHPQAVAATLALAAAQFDAATGSGSPRRIDDAKELMAAASERAGALLRDTREDLRRTEGARPPIPGAVANTRSSTPGAVASTRPAGAAGGAGATAEEPDARGDAHKATPSTLSVPPAPAPTGEPTDAELALARDQVRDALAPLPSRTPRAPVLWGRLGELALQDFVRGGKPHDLVAAAEAFEVAFRTPGDTAHWHRWRLLYGYSKLLRHETSGGAGLLDEAAELLADGLASLPADDDGSDGLRGLGSRLLARCSERRYEYCRDHPDARPQLRLPGLLDQALRHHEAALAHASPRTAEAPDLIETLGRLHLERHRLLGEADIPAATGPTTPAYSDTATGVTWQALAAATYAHALIWRETQDATHAALADPAFDLLAAAPDSLERLPPHVLDTLGRLAHHQGKARSDPATLAHAITLIDLAVQAWPDERQEERDASISLLHQLRLDRLRAWRGARTDDAGEEPALVALTYSVEELANWPDLSAPRAAWGSASLSAPLSRGAGREESGRARLSAARDAVLQAQSCLRRGDLAGTDHHLAAAADIHTTFAYDHPARLETWMLLTRAGLLRDSLARRRGDEPTTHLIAPPAPAQIRRGAARLSGTLRTWLLGEAGVNLLVGGDEGRFTEGLALVREAYTSLDSDDDGYLRYAYYLGSAQCAAATAQYDRARRDAGLDSGIDVLERAAARSGRSGREGSGSIMLALARAYRTREARHLDDRAASLRTGLEAVHALATAAYGREAPYHDAAVPHFDAVALASDAAVARAVSAAREVAAWCCQDGALAQALRLLDLWRALSTPGPPKGPPPTPDEIGRALHASAKDALVYLVPATQSSVGTALVVTAAGRVHTVPLPGLTEDAQPLVEYARAASPGAELLTWAAHTAMTPLLAALQPQRPRLVLVPVGALSTVPWHAARQHAQHRSDRGAAYALEAAEFSYAVSARALCDTAALPRMPGCGTPSAQAPVTAARDPKDALLWLRDGGVLLLAGPVGFQGAELMLPEGPLAVASVAEAIRHSGRPPTAVLVTDCHGDGLTSDAEASLHLAAALLRAGAGAVITPLRPLRDLARSVFLHLVHHFLVAQDATPAAALRRAQLWLLDPQRRPPDSWGPDLAEEARQLSADNPADWAGYVCFGP